MDTIKVPWQPPFVEFLFRDPKSDKFEPSVDGLLVMHPEYRRAFDQLTALEDYDDFDLAEHFVALVAVSRMGKTRLLTEFIRRHMPRRNPSGLHMPALYVWVPPIPTVKNVAAEILRQFGEPENPRDTSDAMRNRIVTLFRNTGVRFFILDDLHHAVDQSGDAVQFALTDWLRQVASLSRCALIMVGLPHVTDFIKINSQLHNRTGAPIRLNRMDWNKEPHQKRFGGIIEVFAKSLQNEFTVQGMGIEDHFRWYLASGGRIGIVSKILKTAIKRARRQKSKQLGYKEFDYAWVKDVYEASSTDAQNAPFRFDGEPTSDLIKAALAAGSIATGTVRAVPKPVKRCKRGRKAAAALVREVLG